MNKYKHATNFYNKYVKLKDTEKEEFSRLTNKMLSNCLLTLKKQKDRKDYFLILSNLSLFQSYFAIMNYELNHHEKDQVLHLINLDNNNQFHLKKIETIILLTLRKLYFIKMQEVSLLDDITVSIEEFHDELLRTGLFSKRITKTELFDSFRVMKKYSLVEVIGDLDKDSSVIRLLPTILYVIPYNKIEEIDEVLKNFEKGESEDEGIEEDSID